MFIPSVIFFDAIFRQARKRVGGVFELTGPLLIQHQSLNPLEGREKGLGAARAEGRDDNSALEGEPPVQQRPLVLLVCPEHQGGAHTLLQHRGQHASGA